MALWDLFQNNTGRIIYKWAHYFPIYERHFCSYVGKPFLFVEIGCGNGGSLQMWKKYFGPYARIVGIDVNPKCKEYEEEQISIRIGNQCDEGFLQSIVDEFGTPDVVLDDGSHIMGDVLSSFRFLYPRLDDTGIYVVEDLHTAYWDEYGGGLGREGTFIEKCKILIDELNADHSRGEVAPTDFTRSTLSMHFYDSMAVFEKGDCGKKYILQTGTL
jgi:SAM-dependent methyltransferase